MTQAATVVNKLPLQSSPCEGSFHNNPNISLLISDLRTLRSELPLPWGLQLVSLDSFKSLLLAPSSIQSHCLRSWTGEGRQDHEESTVRGLTVRGARAVSPADPTPAPLFSHHCPQLANTMPLFLSLNIPHFLFLSDCSAPLCS